MGELSAIIFLFFALVFSAWASGAILLYFFGGDAFSYFKEYRKAKGKSTSFLVFTRCWLQMGLDFTYRVDYLNYLKKNPKKKPREYALRAASFFCFAISFIIIIVLISAK